MAAPHDSAEPHQTTHTRATDQSQCHLHLYQIGAFSHVPEGGKKAKFRHSFRHHASTTWTAGSDFPAVHQKKTHHTAHNEPTACNQTAQIHADLKKYCSEKPELSPHRAIQQAKNLDRTVPSPTRKTKGQSKHSTLPTTARVEARSRSKVLLNPEHLSTTAHVCFVKSFTSFRTTLEELTKTHFRSAPS